MDTEYFCYAVHADLQLHRLVEIVLGFCPNLDNLICTVTRQNYSAFQPCLKLSTFVEHDTKPEGNRKKPWLRGITCLFLVPTGDYSEESHCDAPEDNIMISLTRNPS